MAFVWIESDDTRLDHPGLVWCSGYEWGQQVRVGG